MRAPILPTYRPLRDVHDTEVALRVGSGDREALGELYCRHWRLTARVLLRVASVKDELEDLQQRTWSYHVRITLHSWAPNRCSLSTALGRAAGSCLYRRTHRQKNRQVEELIDRHRYWRGVAAGDQSASAVDRALEMVASHENPEETVAARELLGLVLRTVLEDPPPAPRAHKAQVRDFLGLSGRRVEIGGTDGACGHEHRSVAGAAACLARLRAVEGRDWAPRLVGDPDPALLAAVRKAVQA